MNENFDVIYQTLFRRYYPSLIFYATRLVGEEDAEDVVQDVFVELWRRKNSSHDENMLRPSNRARFLYTLRNTSCVISSASASLSTILTTNAKTRCE